jgi:hypothetical protein
MISSMLLQEAEKGSAMVQIASVGQSAWNPS